jgi:4-amino-4-deoxy-L-arabinose transferase-like glycosyltransferase
LIQCIAFTFSGVAIFLILKRLTSNLFAVTGMGLYLLYPFYIFLSGCLLTEAIYTSLLVLFAFLCVEYLHTGESRYYYLSAFVLGVAFHTRVCSISLIVPLLSLPYLHGRRLDLSCLRKNVTSVVVILLVSVPWGFRNYRVYGKITIPRTFGVEEPSITSLLRQYTSSGRPDSIERVGIARSASYKLRILFDPFITTSEGTDHSSSKSEFSSRSMFQIISFVSVFPLLLSAVVLPAFRRDKFIILLYGFFLFYLLPYFVLTARTRFRLPIDLVMIIFLTLLASRLSEYYLSRRISKKSSVLQTASISKLGT